MPVHEFGVAVAVSVVCWPKKLGLTEDASANWDTMPVMLAVTTTAAVCPMLSVAVIVYVKDPSAVGIPKTRPVAALRLVPGGNVPVTA